MQVRELSPDFVKHIQQVSFMEILPIVAVVLSILAVVIVLVATFLVITRPDTSFKRTTSMKSTIDATPSERWLSYTSTDFDDFLNKFLLRDELAVFRTMAGFLIEDGIDIDSDLSQQMEIGWRNKHKIVQESQVSQRRVYSKSGIIFRMENLEMIERKNSDSSWGGTKHVYRLRIDNEFVRAYVLALQKTKLASI